VVNFCIGHVSKSRDHDYREGARPQAAIEMSLKVEQTEDFGTDGGTRQGSSAAQTFPKRGIVQLVGSRGNFK
jgi:hypothetical protein